MCFVFFCDHAQFADAIYQLNYKFTLKTLPKIFTDGSLITIEKILSKPAPYFTQHNLINTTKRVRWLMFVNIYFYARAMLC